MAENFGAELSEARQGLIMETLKPFPVDQVEHGIKTVIRTSRFFPSIAEILAAIEGPRDDALALQAEDQWSAFLKALDDGALHPATEVYFSSYLDPEALQVVKGFGGSSSIRSWRDQDLPHRRREFLQAYTRRASRSARLAALEAVRRGEIPGTSRPLALAGGEGRS